MKFNIDEMFEIAEHIERIGAKFYRDAARIVSSQQGKVVFLGLAALEDEHEKVYAEMRDKVSPDGQHRDTVYEHDDSAMEYIRAWTDQHFKEVDADVFGDLSGDETLDEIFDKAIRREKATIKFFESLKASVESDSDRQIVDSILSEESQHVEILLRERRSVTE